MKRKIKPIAVASTYGSSDRDELVFHRTVIALAEDGTLWGWHEDLDKWFAWEPLPDDGRAEPPPIQKPGPGR